MKENEKLGHVIMNDTLYINQNLRFGLISIRGEGLFAIWAAHE